MNRTSMIWIAGCAFVVALASGACQSKKNTVKESSDNAHNSRNSVDWSGTYRGTLPCADCPGIVYTLTLNEDNSYQSKMQYLERDNSDFTETGTFKWNDQGSKITLSEGKQQFQVGENRLFQLDRKGNAVEGALAEHYILDKVNESITDRYWKLIEVSGQAVADGSTQKEPFIRLNSAENRLEATGGCNGLGGTYELKDPNRIKFSQLIGTMMACENMDIETGLKEALGAADSYHIHADTLQLFRARMAPLAVFVAQEK